MNHTDIFTPQYAEKSGPGSTLDYSKPYRDFLDGFIKQNKITSILDLGCGDMEIMSHVDLSERVTHDGCPVYYVGVDCIQSRIDVNKRLWPHHNFQCRDLRTHEVIGNRWNEPGSLVLVKDVIQHWSRAEIKAWLDNTFDRSDGKRPYRTFITNCNYGETVNTDIDTGGWRAIDLTKPPFEIGEVVFQWGDKSGGYKDVVLIK